MSYINLIEILKKHPKAFAPLVDVDFQRDNYVVFDFTAQNPELSRFDLTDIAAMNDYVFGKLEAASARVGVGGYDEERAVYQKSPVFATEGGSRSIHLGIDIWMKAGTPIYAPLAAKVHSFQDNNNFGDYGPTIILEHELGEIAFFSLYGHLSRESLTGLFEGKFIEKGEIFAEIGDVAVNGHWTPHLHFQLIRDMLGKKGDFIGVAAKAERAFYLDNCPDPNWILGVPNLS